MSHATVTESQPQGGRGRTQMAAVHAMPRTEPGRGGMAIIGSMRRIQREETVPFAFVPLCPARLPSPPYADNSSKATPELQRRSTLIPPFLKLCLSHVHHIGLCGIRSTESARG